MSLVAPYSAEQVLLAYMVGQATSGTQILKLYTNDYDPAGDVQNCVAASFVEATGVPGYTAATLSQSSWLLITDTLHHYTAQYSAAQTFTFTSASTGVSVYGYYVVVPHGASSYQDRLLWCERFAGAPFSMPSSGGTIAVTPRITLN